MKLSFEDFKKDICGILGLTNTEINMDTDIYDDIGVDSLRLVSLGVKLQNKYNVKVSTADFIELTTIGEIYQCIVDALE